MAHWRKAFIEKWYQTEVSKKRARKKRGYVKTVYFAKSVKTSYKKIPKGCQAFGRNLGWGCERVGRLAFGSLVNYTQCSKAVLIGNVFTIITWLMRRERGKSKHYQQPSLTNYLPPCWRNWQMWTAFVSKARSRLEPNSGLSSTTAGTWKVQYPIPNSWWRRPWLFPKRPFVSTITRGCGQRRVYQTDVLWERCKNLTY